MSDVLLYQTSDPRFADRVLEALQQANISCYRTGTGYAELHPGLNLDWVSGVCIYIRNAEDYQPANQLLIELGAAVEGPVPLPSLRAIFTFALIVALFAAMALEWN